MRWCEGPTKLQNLGFRFKWRNCIFFYSNNGTLSNSDIERRIRLTSIENLIRIIDVCLLDFVEEQPGTRTGMTVKAYSQWQFQIEDILQFALDCKRSILIHYAELPKPHIFVGGYPSEFLASFLYDWEKDQQLWTLQFGFPSLQTP